MKVNPFLMLESNLLAVRPPIVLAGCFRFAMPVRIAATVRRSECEVLLARYAAAPHQRQDEKQRKKRTGQGPQQSSLVYSGRWSDATRDSCFVQMRLPKLTGWALGAICPALR